MHDYLSVGARPLFCRAIIEADKQYVHRLVLVPIGEHDRYGRLTLGGWAYGSWRYDYFVDCVTEIIITPAPVRPAAQGRSEEHTSELQSLTNIVCRLLLAK